MLNKDKVRELVFLARVDAVNELPGYDRVESATVGGWHCIVPKGQFAPGSIGIYFEIDSRVDAANPAFAFMEKRNYKVKTQKMCKSISQGLLMHPSDFGWTVNDDAIVTDSNGNIHNVDDESKFLTSVLKVTYADDEDVKRKANVSVDKYKKMVQRRPDIFKRKWVQWFMRRNWGKKLMFLFFGKKKDNIKSFPTHLPYIHRSDEERIENMPWILGNKTRWVKTTKIDGTSSLFLLERKGKKREYWVCSRNVRQLDRNQECYHNDNAYWEANDKYHIQDFLEDILNKYPELEYVALQGETAGCTSSGAKLQGDPHKFGELRFFGYNFITSDKGRWNSIDAANLCKKYGIEWVPIVDDNYILPDSFEDFKKSADGECEAPGASGAREGYVYRNYDDNTLSFKNVSREYLLKH